MTQALRGLICASLLIVATAKAQTASVATAPNISSSSKIEILPLHAFGRQFTIDAEVKGKRHTFLFDTGEGLTMISPALAEEIGCEPWGNVAAFRMTGERLDAPHCDNVAFRLGSYSHVAPTVIVYDLSEIAGKEANSPDGSMGLDLFAGQTITIDFAAKHIVVESSSSAQKRIRECVEIPMRMSRNDGTVLDVNLGVPTSKGVVWMELDTANAGPTIFASQSTAPLLGLNPDTREPQAVELRLSSGEVFKTRARVFPSMVIDGNIGMQLVGQRAITLDLHSGRAWLAKPSH